MVEVDVPARSGDSGGPILNEKGQVAGVLFGSAFGRTTGTFCRRVQWFLEEPFAMLERLPANPTMLAEAKKHEVDPSPVLTTIPERSCPVARLPEDRDADPAALLPLPDGERDPQLAELSSELPDRPKQRISLEDLPEAKTNAEKQLTAAVPAQSHLPTRADQIKNILAVIGLIAVLFHGLRFLALAAN